MSEIGKNLIKNPVGQSTKKKTFNIGDFKKFKYMKNIESNFSEEVTGTHENPQDIHLYLKTWNW